MSELWYSLSNLKCNSSNIISANALVTADSPWFSGHFPGEPILPGVAELSIVFDIIKNHEKKSGKNIKISSIKRVKFRLPVKPDESLDITVATDKNKANSYSFELMIKGKIACSGNMKVEYIE